jgi:CDP-glycerol glycerophosphotransferase (TagB/SpsB family)
MKVALILVGMARGLARGLYALLKLFPTRDKVTFISRNNDFASIDFRVLAAEIRSQSPRTKVVYLNHPMRNKLVYIFLLARQMCHIATSRAVVLDTYSIPISILKHKKDLIVVQIWHALGAFKAFGLLSVDKPEGSSGEIAAAMRMHQNYTYVSAPSVAVGEIYQACFGVAEDQIVVAGSPRVDYLTDSERQEQQRVSIRAKYGLDPERQVVLFTPTWRKNTRIPIDDLITAIDFDRYELLFRKHPLDSDTDISDPRVIVPDEREGLELLAVADHLITDYSAIAFEAVTLGVPCYFWVFDKQEYAHNRGFVIDLDKYAPGPISSQVGEILHAIDSPTAHSASAKAFKQRYITTTGFNNSRRLAELMLDLPKTQTGRLSKLR